MGRVLVKRRELLTRMDELNLSQATLARQLGISTTQLSQIVNAKVTTRRSTAIAITSLLGKQNWAYFFDEIV